MTPEESRYRGTVSTEQARYQVRFDWGIDGATAIATDADVIVWVDAFGGDVPLGSLPSGAAVIEANLASSAAVAHLILERQQELNKRLTIGVVAAGASRGSAQRFAVEDLLAAGSVIDQLATLGIDAVSPEAAAAEGAFAHLRGAVRHLATASVSAVNGEQPASAILKLDPDAVPKVLRA